MQAPKTKRGHLMVWKLIARRQIEHKEAVYKMLMKIGYGTQRRIFKYWHSYVNVLYYCASMQMRIALRLWWQAVELGRKAHSALLLFCGRTLRSCMYEWKKLLVTEHHWRGRLLQKWLDVWKYRCGVQRTLRAFYCQFTRGKLHVYFSAMKLVVVYQAEHLRQLSKMAASRGITVNAIAPGFIETRLTAAIPVMIREAARRLSNLSQGGQPRDVGDAITFLATPGSLGLTGQVLRVCGGALVGA